MSGSRFSNPFANAYSPTGASIPGALLYFYAGDSTVQATTYSDADLTVPNPWPVVADASGTFPSIFLNPTILYKAKLTYPNQGAIPGAVIYNTYPVSGGGGSAAGSFVTPEQFGATGVVGHNDQPAIQAAINYAVAHGISAVQFNAPAYELWQTIRTHNLADLFNYLDGVLLLIGGDVAMIGAENRTTFTIKGPTGTTRGQAVADGTWYGGCFVYSGTGVTRSVIRNINLVGGYTYPNNGNVDSNVSDKAVLINDASNLAPNMVWVDHRDCHWDGFRGEIWYMGGTFANCVAYTENLELSNSPQSAWNAGSGAKVTAINLYCHDSYQAAETISGAGHVYIDGTFYHPNGRNSTFVGNASFPTGFPYTYPNRPAGVGYIGTQFHGTVFKGGSVSFTAFVTARDVVFEDCAINSFGNSAMDIDIEGTNITDNSSGSSVCGVQGPANLTTQYAGAPAGNYYTPPQNVNVRMRMRRTKAAQDAGRVNDFFTPNGGLVDASCSFILTENDGALRYLVSPFGSTTGMTKFPLVDGPLGAGQFDGAQTDSPAADIAYKATSVNLALSPSAAVSISADLSIVPTDGQRWRIWCGANSSTIRFTPGAAGMDIPTEIVLRSSRDYIEFRARNGRWQYDHHFTASPFDTPQVLTYAATVTPDFRAYVSSKITLTGNLTLANPTGVRPGQNGVIRLVQDGTGSRIITYGANYRFPGGSASAGVLSTAANAIDVLSYFVGDDSLIYCALGRAFAV